MDDALKLFTNDNGDRPDVLIVVINERGLNSFL